jgi:hypothetical protein
MPAAKPRTDLRVVGPDLSEIERIVVEAAAETQPLIPIESTTRERFINEMRELEGKRDALVEKRDLYQRQLDAAIAGLNVQIADHDATISIYRGGLANEA